MLVCLKLVSEGEVMECVLLFLLAGESRRMGEGMRVTEGEREREREGERECKKERENKGQTMWERLQPQYHGGVYYLINLYISPV